MPEAYRATISTVRDGRDAFPGSVGTSRRQELLGETEGRGSTPRGSSQSRLPVASAPTFLIRPPRRRLYTTSRLTRTIGGHIAKSSKFVDHSRLVPFLNIITSPSRLQA
uniref:Uncharacterized protein n=1 Tax=Caenorhabditis japonica TaxID=281687 RepID=A0A8R1IVG6_CAEJA